jgi:hypothetical protein
MLLLGLFLAASQSTVTQAATTTDSPKRVDLQGRTVTYPKGKSHPAIVGDELKAASGPTRIVVQLEGDPLALVPNGGNALANQIDAQETAFMNTLATKYGATEVTRFHRTARSLVIKVDAANIPAIATEAGVTRINGLGYHALADNDTAPYIGASTASTPPLPAGLTGAGLTVAVVDTGVDYTHLDLGGPGTVAAYQQCAASGVADAANYADLPAACKALFGPGAPKVIGGKDFIGEISTGADGLEQIDANPIDFEGHGSHVSDIITGVNPNVQSIAPGAKIYALKVCSDSPSGYCSDLAILEAIEFFVDPNGDNNLSDHVDVANFSLGADFGQTNDYETYVLNAAATLGVTVVASAGNGGDKPYIVGQPSIASKVISVAETTIPISRYNAVTITSPANIAGNYRALYQDWSTPFTSTLSGNIVFIGEACTLSSVPAAPAPGTIALAQRTPGACYVSTRALNATLKGYSALVFGTVVPGDPLSFGNGDGLPPSSYVPTFNTNYDDFVTIKNAIAAGTVTATLNPATILSYNTAGRMVSTSSRGTRTDGKLKPEIGAPGGSTSALVGTGTKTGAFGGTSGAAPMISGTALLIKQKYPTWDPVKIKSLLMNTAYTDILTPGANNTTYATPISRIGAGEVRVNQAARSGILATVPGDDQAAISFGFQTIDNNVKVFTKKVTLKSLETTGNGRLYNISYKFRNNPNGAISLSGPSTVWLAPGQEQTITVQLMLTGQKVPTWPFTSIPGGNAGELGGTTAVLDSSELDGYMVVDGGKDNKVTLPFYILPHKATNVAVKSVYDTWNNGPVKALQLGNDLGVVKARVDTFNLLGTSPKKATNSTTIGSWDIDLKEFGIREVTDTDGSTALQFAVTTFDRRATPNLPNLYDIIFQTSTGERFEVLNEDLSQLTGAGGLDGSNVVGIFNLSSGAGNIYYYTQADFNSGNAILTIPIVAPEIGLDLTGKTIRAAVSAYDFYYGGGSKDSIAYNDPLSTWPTYKVGSPKFTLSKLPWTNAGTLSSDGLTLTFDQNGTQVQFNKKAGVTTSSKGLLLLYRDAVSKESDVVLYP